MAGSHRSEIAIRAGIKWLRGVGISACRVPLRSHFGVGDFQGWLPPLQPPWEELGGSALVGPRPLDPNHLTGSTIAYRLIGANSPLIVQLG